MHISIEQNDDVAVVYASGEIDAATCGKLEESLNKLIGEGQTAILLDLQEVPYISSAGLRVILIATKRMYGSGAFSLCRLQDSVRGMLEVAGFRHFMNIYEDMEIAKTALSGSS